MQELRYYIRCDRCPAHEEYPFDLLWLASGQHRGPLRISEHAWYKHADDDVCEKCYDNIMYAPKPIDPE